LTLALLALARLLAFPALTLFAWTLLPFLAGRHSASHLFHLTAQVLGLLERGFETLLAVLAAALDTGGLGFFQLVAHVIQRLRGDGAARRRILAVAAPDRFAAEPHIAIELAALHVAERAADFRGGLCRRGLLHRLLGLLQRLDGAIERGLRRALLLLLHPIAHRLHLGLSLRLSLRLRAGLLSLLAPRHLLTLLTGLTALLPLLSRLTALLALLTLLAALLTLLSLLPLLALLAAALELLHLPLQLLGLAAQHLLLIALLRGLLRIPPLLV